MSRDIDNLCNNWERNFNMNPSGQGRRFKDKPCHNFRPQFNPRFGPGFGPRFDPRMGIDPRLCVPPPMGPPMCPPPMIPPMPRPEYRQEITSDSDISTQSTDCGFIVGSNGCNPGEYYSSKPNYPIKSFNDPGLHKAEGLICNERRNAVTTWRINYLVSNRTNQAAHLDPLLINPWGIAIYNNQLWVVNGSTDCMTNYDLFGNSLLGAISLRDTDHNSSFPTGLAINCAGGFPVTNGTISKSGIFLTASEHGTVHVYNPNVDQQNSFLVINRQLSAEVSVYRGIAIANNTLYLANFNNRRIDVFDSNYQQILNFPFIDADTCEPIPLDFGPTNIVHIGEFLYVIWAKMNPILPINDVSGPGLGYVSVFRFDGTFVCRFTSRGVLNAPWAMIPAPCECGFPPGSFLIGNNGDGRINVFDFEGKYVGPMLNMSGLPIVLDGLWGLAPHYTEFSEIFFTAAPDENVDGLVGSIVKDQVIYF